MMPLYAQEQDLILPSRNLWASCPALDKSPLERCGLGTSFFNDFETHATGTYTLTQATAGTGALKEAAGGWYTVDAGSTTTTQGPNIQFDPCGFVPTADLDIYMEIKLTPLSGIGTAGNYFFGLAATDTTLIASSALSSQAIGFVGLGVNTITGTTKSGGGAASTATLATLAAGTSVKLGMRISLTKVKCYVDGVLSSEVLTTYIATATMRPTIVVQSRGTTQPILEFDWFNVFQSRTA